MYCTVIQCRGTKGVVRQKKRTIKKKLTLNKFWKKKKEKTEIHKKVEKAPTSKNKQTLLLLMLSVFILFFLHVLATYCRTDFIFVYCWTASNNILEYFAAIY